MATDRKGNLVTMACKSFSFDFLWKVGDPQIKALNNNYNARGAGFSKFAVCALILAYIFGSIRRWVINGRKHSIDIQPATSSTAGLAHLEVLADRQAQSLQALARQVTKVQLKTRLVGHDTKPLLRKVQQENLKQAEELAAQATQIAAVTADLQDTQKLLSALQSVSGKQFEVVIKVLKQQQQQQKPKLQPAQAPLQPFDVIPSQHA
ncbi:hypothetical protein WJX79_009771 [Trebouxia sp. C0005]